MSKNILVFAEHIRGQLPETTFEAVGLGRELADQLGVACYAVLLGGEVGPMTAQLGQVDRVLVADNAALNAPSVEAVVQILQGVTEQHEVGLILIPGTNQCIGVGALYSARTGRPHVNFCRQVQCAGEGLKLSSQLFGGKILADLAWPDPVGVITLYPGAYAAAKGKSEKAPESTEPIPVEGALGGVTFNRYIEPEVGDVDITKQTVLVAVGRGIQSGDDVAEAESLAEALGGAVCGSRPVIDQGWLPLSRQVGKSGMTVAPRVYLAFGISGAPEHWEGMQNSECIIAVNTDPDAPVFDGAHYGAVGDALDLIPLLTEKARERKG